MGWKKSRSRNWQSGTGRAGNGYEKMVKQYVGAEQEMDVYSPVYLKPPVAVSQLVKKVLPGRFAERLETGIRLKEKSAFSWRKLYDKFVEEGGFPQEHRKFDTAKKGVWLDKGDRYYGDSQPVNSPHKYPEFCTPLTEVKKGFSEEAKNVVMLERARALKAAGKESKVRVSNTHYNISMLDGVNVEELYETLGPAYALLMFSDNRRFCSMRKRQDAKRGGGVEIAAPALMDPDQIRAAEVFLTGTLNGLKKDGAPLRAVISERRRRDSNSEYTTLIGFENGTDYELPIMNNGPNAILGTNMGMLTAREYFKKCLGFYRKHIERYATEDDMKVLDELAEGKRQFEIEKRPSHLVDADYIKGATGKTPDRLIADFKPTGAAVLFADSVKNQVKKMGKGLTRKTRHIGWEKITFRFSDGIEEQDIDVPLSRMGAYMKIEGKMKGLSELKEEFL